MFFAILTLLSALSLAVVADWFSIVGLMAILSGQPIPAIVLGVTLALGKLVSTSWLYRNWEKSSLKLKIPLIYFTLTLMVITSIGVFGFLSQAHVQQGSSTINNSAKVEEIIRRIDIEKSKIDDNTKVIAQLDTTVNSFIGKDKTDRALSVRKSQEIQRKQLKQNSDEIESKITELNQQKFELESEVRKLQVEVGPIRYISQLIYGDSAKDENSLEAAVRLFTLLIVSTLDPLAIVLLIAANFSIANLKQKEDEIPIVIPESSSIIEENIEKINIPPIVVPEVPIHEEIQVDLSDEQSSSDPGFILEPVKNTHPVIKRWIPEFKRG